jgi:HSP20 family protein
MSMSRWEPVESPTPLRDAITQLLEDSFIHPMRFGVLTRTFLLDVYETESEYVVEAMLPGVKPDDVKITAVRDTLTIHATVKPTVGKESGTPTAYLRRERYEGEMVRTIELPTEIQVEKVIATYEHGILTLHVPKAEAVKPRQIPIRLPEAAGGH